MREHSFELWDKEKNGWYVPTYAAYKGELEYVVLNMNGSLTMIANNERIHESLFPDRFIKCFYTGLKDSNGVEIAEGNILFYEDGEYSYTGIVEYSDFTYFIKDIAYSDAHSFEDITDNGVCSAKVIGNIYEDKNLLGELIQGNDSVLSEYIR